MAVVEKNHQTTNIPSSANGEQETYWLGRTSDEQKRLIKQHETWTKNVGYLLHPSIPPSLPPNAQIADIATGTGIWLKDLAAISPSTYQFHGYDISFDALLPAQTFPSNISFSELNIKKPIPADLRGKFDVVNVRLITLVMGTEDVWKATLKNLVDLVKPGGVLQWTEGCFNELRVVRGGSGDASPGKVLHEAMRQAWGHGQSPENIMQTAPLAKWFQEEGRLADITEDVVASDRVPETREDFTMMSLGAVFTVMKAKLTMMREKGRVEERAWTLEELVQKEKEALREVDAGAYVKCDLQVVVGRRKE